MVRVCSACHAPEIAAQQRLSAQGWKDLVDTMASRGAPGSEADFAEITAYLAKNFPDKPTN
jgi:mono/diheme cytochrome c family protein